MEVDEEEVVKQEVFSKALIEDAEKILYSNEKI
jgi:hypothetical protein